MKKSYVACSLFVLSLLSSCDLESSANSIDVDDIKKPCDCMNAYEVVASEMLELLSGFENMDDFEEDEDAVSKGEELKNKYEEIDDRCDELSFPKSDLKECASFESVSAKMKEINKKMGL